MVFALGYASPWWRLVYSSGIRSASRTGGTLFSLNLRDVAAGVVVMAFAVLIPLACGSLRPGRFAAGTLAGVASPWAAGCARRFAFLHEKLQSAPLAQGVTVHVRPTPWLIVASVAVVVMVLLAPARTLIGTDD